MQRDDATLIDILFACGRLMDFVRGVSRDAFEANVEKQAAVMYELMVIGEATKRLSREFLDAHPQVPWLNIGGMRNRLIHEYDKVDAGKVWDAATVHVPALMQYLQPLAPKPQEGT